MELLPSKQVVAGSIPVFRSTAVECQNSIRVWRAAPDPLRDRQGVAGSGLVSRSER
jgi:hypothetical protein